jgi:hypothetical protein
MPSVRRIALAFAVAIVATLVLPSAPAGACSCAQTTVAESVSSAGGVYVAEPEGATAGSEQTFRVLRVLRGPDQAQLRAVVTGGGEASCGTTIRDEPYVLLTDGAGRPQQLHLCSHHLIGADAVAEARQTLGDGVPPTHADADEAAGWSWLLPGLVIAAAVAGWFVIGLRRRRPG